MAVSSTAVQTYFGERIPSSYANFWGGRRPSLRRPFHRPSETITKAKTKRRKTSERRMNICKLQRSAPLDGSRITVQSAEQSGGKKRFGDHHEEEEGCRLGTR